jgi:hypothetical protein
MFRVATIFRDVYIDLLYKTFKPLRCGVHVTLKKLLKILKILLLLKKS